MHYRKYVFDKMDKPLDYVFIDTSVLMKESYFKEFGRVAKLFNLASKGYIKILLPIITKREWIKHLTEATFLKFDEVGRKTQLLGKIAGTSELVEKFELLVSDYSKLVENSMPVQLSRANVIEIDYPFFMDTIPDVFEKYFNQSKPFGSQGKNKEFPDAFVLASLEKYAETKDIEQIIVFSTDKDMTQYQSDKLKVDDIGKYLDDLIQNRIPTSNEEKKQRDIKTLFSYIESANPILKKNLEKQIVEFLSDPNLYVYRFGYVDIDEVFDLHVSLEITAKDMEIISVSDGEIEAICFPEIDANVKVKHFSEEDSIWDSEDKEYFYEHYETTLLEISSYLNVTLKFCRDELELGQEPNIQIEDIDFSALEDSINEEWH